MVSAGQVGSNGFLLAAISWKIIARNGDVNWTTKIFWPNTFGLFSLEVTSNYLKILSKIFAAEHSLEAAIGDHLSAMMFLA